MAICGNCEGTGAEPFGRGCTYCNASGRIGPLTPKFTRPGMYPWLVVITRESAPTVTPFANEQDARDFYDVAATQWGESYLCRVEIGPVV